MYPKSKQRNFGEITDMIPFYAYLNRLFRRTVIPREGDGAKIPPYNKNILVVMAPNANGFEFSVFDFIREEIKAISENSLKSCGYASHAYDRENDSSHILFREGAPPLTDQE
jgi:hypothetical protein